MEGRLVGRYCIGEKIAVGGMGEIYAASHESIRREAVIKILLPGVAGQEQIAQRFFQEAELAAMIRHPGVVEIFDYGETEDGRAFMIMERLYGETMYTRVERCGTLPVALVVTLMRQLAGALAATHRCGVVHRDLKPSNLMIAPDPEVPGGERIKVFDFGLAKKQGDASSKAAISPVTVIGTVFGTPAYMAPEQCFDAAAVDHRADLYSMGCIFYRCLAGGAPFGDGSGTEVLAAQIRDQAVPLRHKVPGIPVELDAVVERLLEKSLDRRFQTCDELADALAPDSPVGRAVAQLPAQGSASRSSASQMQVAGDPGSWSHDHGGGQRGGDRHGGHPGGHRPSHRPSGVVPGGPDDAVIRATFEAVPQVLGSVDTSPMSASGSGSAFELANPGAGHRLSPGVTPAGATRGGHPRAPSTSLTHGTGEMRSSSLTSQPGVSRDRRRSVRVATVASVLLVLGVMIGGLVVTLGLGNEEPGFAGPTPGLVTDAGSAGDARVGPGDLVDDPEVAAAVETALIEAQARIDEQAWSDALEVLGGLEALDIRSRDSRSQIRELEELAQDELQNQIYFERFGNAARAFQAVLDRRKATTEDVRELVAGHARVPETSVYRSRANRVVRKLSGQWLEQVSKKARRAARSGRCDKLETVLADVTELFPEALSDFEPLVQGCREARDGDTSALEEEHARRRRARAKEVDSSLDDLMRANTLAGEAREAYLHDHLGQAWRTCQESLELDPGDVTARYICSMTACKFLADKADAARSARLHASKLSASRRSSVAQECANRGIALDGDGSGDSGESAGATVEGGRDDPDGPGSPGDGSGDETGSSSEPDAESDTSRSE